MASKGKRTNRTQTVEVASLSEYSAKRELDTTPEPRAADARSSGRLLYRPCWDVEYWQGH